MPRNLSDELRGHPEGEWWEKVRKYLAEDPERAPHLPAEVDDREIVCWLADMHCWDEIFEEGER